MTVTRKATATWSGTGKEGSGSITTTSGALKNTPHTYHSRFVSEDGKEATNPEELVAAAHASCFTMKLSFLLNDAGFTAEKLECTANVMMDKLVTGIHLDLKASMPGISNEIFQGCAEQARATCPMSQLLKSVPITLTAVLL